jgi:hypothetical protein
MPNNRKVKIEDFEIIGFAPLTRAAYARWKLYLALLGATMTSRIVRLVTVKELRELHSLLTAFVDSIGQEQVDKLMKVLPDILSVEQTSALAAIITHVRGKT